ncbi:hypothetical protein P4S64_06350 [Vibrio sp. M60_M31a]
MTRNTHWRRRSYEGVSIIPSVLSGPTCDSIDVIAENVMLPKLENGDLIIGRMMGAYNRALQQRILTSSNVLKRL